MNDEKKNRKHKQSMQALKSRVDSSIAAAQTEKGLCVLLSGDGKGKSTSGFGMVMRSLGYGHRVGIVQFIKGEQLSGEEIYLREKYPDMPFYQMGTGFTWDTQDRQADIVAAERTWAYAEELLKNASIDLVLLDELTYMLAFKYLEEEQVVNAISRRPAQQSVVITGRGGGTGLRELADTVSEISSPKHAYESGIKARKGVDF
ncbi:MAG: cob(I)yrinic acid a,c-diamide adenosyltransferase [Gammaproteobacteria bacterium]|nr:cob(I)yrinic acid a,c-diamide adenosyltransferase [Gammaproteobacteria bacterium]|tara:strand:- start:248419 stop:249027 length:609 start_codon:yes stop_codon:yes gene_type:complete